MFKPFKKINSFKRIFNNGKINRFLLSFSGINKKDIDYSPYRIFVSELILKVLSDKLTVREALLEFPKDIEEPTLQTAWLALCHREADEDIRKMDLVYADEQDEYLEMIAFTMQKGEALPQNIINEYKKYQEEAPISYSTGVAGIFKKLMRFLNI